MVLYKAVAAWPLAFSHTTFPDSVILAAAQCCVACVSVIISVIPTVWCHLYDSLAAAETHPWHLPQPVAVSWVFFFALMCFVVTGC